MKSKIKEMLRPIVMEILAERKTKINEVAKYKVVWTDRNYKEHIKIFKDDPNGPAENGLTKAKQFKKKLEDKDSKTEYGEIRSIRIVFESKKV